MCILSQKVEEGTDPSPGRESPDGRGMPDQSKPPPPQSIKNKPQRVDTGTGLLSSFESGGFIDRGTVLLSAFRSRKASGVVVRGLSSALFVILLFQ